LTFGVRGAAGAVQAQLQGLLVFAVGLGLTSGVLALLAAAAPAASRLVEVAVLLAATVAATLVRFTLFRRWIFRPAAPPDEESRPVPARPAVTAAVPGSP
jgi:putative flippase GtrA